MNGSETDLFTLYHLNMETLSMFFFLSENIPFQNVHHLVNPWNDNKKVQISRDGQVCKRILI